RPQKGSQAGTGGRAAKGYAVRPRAATECDGPAAVGTKEIHPAGSIAEVDADVATDRSRGAGEEPVRLVSGVETGHDRDVAADGHGCPIHAPLLNEGGIDIRAEIDNEIASNRPSVGQEYLVGRVVAQVIEVASDRGGADTQKAVIAGDGIDVDGLGVVA